MNIFQPIVNVWNSIVGVVNKTDEQKALSLSQTALNAIVALTPFVELIPGIAPFQADIAAAETLAQNLITQLTAIVNAQK